MVGGIVIEVTEPKTRPEAVYVNCRDRTYGRDTCAILVEKNEQSLKIEVGDSLWWQGNRAMWTPAAEREKEGGREGVDYEIEIPRIGFSGIKRPN